MLWAYLLALAPVSWYAYLRLALPGYVPYLAELILVGLAALLAFVAGGLLTILALADRSDFGPPVVLYAVAMTASLYYSMERFRLHARILAPIFSKMVATPMCDGEVAELAIIAARCYPRVMVCLQRTQNPHVATLVIKTRLTADFHLGESTTTDLLRQVMIMCPPSAGKNVKLDRTILLILFRASRNPTKQSVECAPG